MFHKGGKNRLGKDTPGQDGAPPERLRPRFGLPGRKCVPPGATSWLLYEFLNFKAWDSFCTAVGAGALKVLRGLGTLPPRLNIASPKEVSAPGLQSAGCPSRGLGSFPAPTRRPALRLQFQPHRRTCSQTSTHIKYK